MKFKQPDDIQMDGLAERLDGLEETWGNALEKNLIEMNLDPNLKHSVIFIDNLETRVFCCEECDHWRRVEIRVYNEIADRKMCEDCDENY
ncbi:hypothetical protein KARL1_94 [Acinetobacter phage KARL-1]|uniref:Uncharacterized protein n=1 Tax=Acinetobacter phage KARL-1 TaxID=2301662 RepID=A0A385IIJ5_9CAUD|nr:hypothetical protein HYP70_gp094 [Acinetobacter phage KARL-1]AXY82713.1 hypothetical protein KARL1_94 [Acinetobacter phage KARL-1]